jgi:hypothetical protein
VHELPPVQIDQISDFNWGGLRFSIQTYAYAASNVATVIAEITEAATEHLIPSISSENKILLMNLLVDYFHTTVDEATKPAMAIKLASRIKKQKEFDDLA